jgi:hypothetical protein
MSSYYVDLSQTTLPSGDGTQENPFGWTEFYAATATGIRGVTGTTTYYLKGTHTDTISLSLYSGSSGVGALYLDKWGKDPWCIETTGAQISFTNTQPIPGAGCYTFASNGIIRCLGGTTSNIWLAPAIPFSGDTLGYVNCMIVSNGTTASAGIICRFANMATLNYNFNFCNLVGNIGATGTGTNKSIQGRMSFCLIDGNFNNPVGTNNRGYFHAFHTAVVTGATMSWTLDDLGGNTLNWTKGFANWPTSTIAIDWTSSALLANISDISYTGTAVDPWSNPRNTLGFVFDPFIQKIRGAQFQSSVITRDLINSNVVGMGLQQDVNGSLKLHTAPNSGVVADASGLYLDTYRETPAGLVDGSNTVFNTTFNPVTGTELVFVNGVLCEQGVEADYTISGKTITFVLAPRVGDLVNVIYYVASRV